MGGKISKCVRSTGANDAVFCYGMKERGEPAGNCKGFQYVDVINHNDGDGVWKNTIGITYHRTARDKGTVLNFCPWCGEAILWSSGTAGKKEPVKS